LASPPFKPFMTNSKKRAVLYRMILPDHECPFGVRAKQILEEAGFEVEEHILATREEVDDYMDREGVARTPQVFIDGSRIGGSDELERHLVGADAD
jgi:glutaredoxin